MKSPGKSTFTRRMFCANKERILQSVISLLFSQGFLIDYVNENVGLISANERREYKYKEEKASSILWGFSPYKTYAYTSKVNFYIKDFNNGLSEVRITIYVRTESTTSSWARPNLKNKNERMVGEPAAYEKWFNDLEDEIEPLKARMRNRAELANHVASPLFC